MGESKNLWLYINLYGELEEEFRRSYSDYVAKRVKEDLEYVSMQEWGLLVLTRGLEVLV